MANGSRPSVVLTSKKSLSETAAKRLKDAWNQLFAGLQNVGATVVLEDGIDVKPLQLTSVDLVFIKQREFQVTDIARFWRVPPFKLGLTELRGVNLVQVDQDYVTNTGAPNLHRWKSKLMQVFDLEPDEYEVDFDETQLLRADITSRY